VDTGAERKGSEIVPAHGERSAAGFGVGERRIFVGLSDSQGPVPLVTAHRLASDLETFAIVEDGIDDNSEAAKHGPESPDICCLTQNRANLVQVSGGESHLLAPLSNQLRHHISGTRNINRTENQKNRTIVVLRLPLKY
jgi:hypothetical protein